MIKKWSAASLFPSFLLVLALSGCADYYGGNYGYPPDADPGGYPGPPYPYPGPTYPTPYPGHGGYYGPDRYWPRPHHEEHRNELPRAEPSSPPLAPQQRLHRVERKIERNRGAFGSRLEQLEKREARQENRIEQRFDRMERQRLENMERRGASEERQRALREQLQQREERREQRLHEQFDAREARLRQRQAEEAARLERQRERLEQKIQSSFQPPPAVEHRQESHSNDSGSGGHSGCGPRKRQRGEC